MRRLSRSCSSSSTCPLTAGWWLISGVRRDWRRRCVVEPLKQPCGVVSGTTSLLPTTARSLGRSPRSSGDGLRARRRGCAPGKIEPPGPSGEADRLKFALSAEGAYCQHELRPDGLAVGPELRGDLAAA